MKKITMSIMILVVGVFFIVNPTKADIDLGGETLTMTCFSDSEGQFEEGGDREGFLEETEEKFNVNIEFEQFNWWGFEDEMMTRLLAGDATTDVWRIDSRHFWPLIGNEALYPVSKELPDDYYHQVPNYGGLPQGTAQTMHQTFNHQGVTYSFGDIGTSFIFIVYNKTLLEREGQPDPHDLYEQGEWTWDTFEEIMRAVTRDTDGDGEVDQWGLAGSDPSFNFFSFLMSNEAFPIIEEDGKIKFSYNQKNATNGLQRYHDWFGVYEVKNNETAFQEGKTAFALLIDWQLDRKIIRSGFEDEYGVILLPKGPDAEQCIAPSEALTGFVLPASNKLPEESIQVFDYLFRPIEDDDLKQQYPQLVRDSKSFEIMLEGVKRWQPKFSTTFEGILGYRWGSSNVYVSATHQIISGERSAQAIMDEITPEIQAKIDETVNQ